MDLPAGTDRSQLVLTVGTLQDVYEVYVNGWRIGATSSFDSFEDARIPRPMTFEIPAPMPGETTLYRSLSTFGASCSLIDCPTQAPTS